MTNLSRAITRSLAVCAVLAMMFTVASPVACSHAAEDTQLLSITGDQIDVLETVDEDTKPSVVIDSYYRKLSKSDQQQAAELKQDLISLIPNYEIAFAAADTAEMNSVLSKVAFRWAVLRTFHAEHFTDPARAALYSAYVEQYLLLN